MRVVGCSLCAFVASRSLCVVGWLLLFVVLCFSLSDVRCWLCAVCCLLFVDCCLRFAVCNVLFNVCGFGVCLLFVVFVVWYVLFAAA